MSKYQTLIDALAAEGLSDFPWMAFGPSNDAAPPDYYDEVVAVRSDAQVQVICRAPRDRDDACTADMTYIAKANPVTVRALLADLEVAEKALAALAQQPQEPVAWMLHLAGKPQRASVSKPSLDGYHPDFSLRPLVYGDTTSPSPQVPAPVDERAEFEACAPMAGSLFKRRADDPDKYWDGSVQDDWELWQARAALQSPSPKTKGQP